MSMAEVIRECAQQYGISRDEIMMRNQRRPAIRSARRDAMWRGKYELGRSLNQIGRAFNGLDHTTVMYAIRKHQERLNAERRQYSGGWADIFGIRAHQKRLDEGLVT